MSATSSEEHDLLACNVNNGAHRKGITLNEMVEFYSKWGETGGYDEDLCPGTYNGPKYAAEAIQKVIGDKAESRILDCAAGTGFLGVELNKLGYTNIDALEPAHGMLERAREKEVYTNFIEDYIDNGHNKMIADGSYDVLGVAGGMGEGHIPCSALKEMARIVKPGGYVVIVMREEYLETVQAYKGHLEPLMKQMEKEGIWQTVSRVVVPKYSFENNGVIFTFKVSPDSHSASNSEHDAAACCVNDGAHRKGIMRNEMTEYYSKWGESGDYERDLCPGTYNGPLYAAEAVFEVLGKERLDAHILDCAAGTGFLGVELSKLGFTNIDALEPAHGMLKKAGTKGVFTKLIEDYIDFGHNTDIPNDSYDVLVVAGGMGEGHIPCDGLKEMARIVKPGGHVCIVMREEYLQTVEEYRDRLEPLMSEMERVGKWELVSRTIRPKYSFNNDGVIYMFRVECNGF